MKALSIRQPWAFAICYFGKRVENRDWDLRGGNITQARRLIGSDILIHAAKGCTYDEWEEAAYFMSSFAHLNTATERVTLKTIPRGVIVATAKLGRLTYTTLDGHRNALRRIECDLCGEPIPEMGGAPCPKADPWAIPGTAGLIFDDVRPLPRPVPFKGALGFFEVPDYLIGGAL